MIPKVIYQTFETKEMPMGMSQAVESWKQKNQDYQHQLFDAKDRVEFIKQHFNADVLDAYYSLIPGAFKADLWRYCILYKNGGIYADADMICELPLKDLIEEDDRFIISRDDPMALKWLTNGFICAEKEHPVFKLAIGKIVEKCKAKQLEFYLDYTGPALLGKCLNEYLGKGIEDDYELGKLSNGIKMMNHDFARTKLVYDGKDIVHVEYPGKVAEMDSIGNKKFWDYVQAETIFCKIPRKIIYTSYDVLDINDYMVNSFSKNDGWEMIYFDDEAVDRWFAGGIYDKAYLKLKEKGERTDFFRYCYLYENGGVYTDSDTFNNKPLDEWISWQNMIVGLEANIDAKADIGFNNIGRRIGDKIISVCNWTIAVAPKHPALSALINDIIDNPKDGVLQNTGPGRFTKHILDYFGTEHDFNEDIEVNGSQLLSINRFGSNQSHSGAYKSAGNPLQVADSRIYITHMFDGSWRDNTKREKINRYKQEHCSHNLSLWKTDDGFKGIARLDEDTSRTKFMEELGDCRSIYELSFNADLTLKDTEIRNIDYKHKAKFEDYRTFNYKNETYHIASYIDEEWNTKECLLDSAYKYIGDINIDGYNKVGWMGKDEVIWEKNWLPFEHNGELHFIYNTSPNYVVYKLTDWDTLTFEKIIDVENPYNHMFPKDELYFTKAVSVGGSSAPIWIEEEQCYIYLVHTKIYQHRCYNHYAVKLDKNLNIINIGYKPFISRLVPFALFFITSMIDEGSTIVISGGLEDNTNFTWRIPKSLLTKTFK